jgi:hypothetical protein
MKNLVYIILASFSLFLYSCEEPYFPPTTPEDQQIVIEGFVETGDDALPTYVLVTKSLPYVTTFSPKGINDIFVKNANVEVFDGVKTTKLQLICTSQLPKEIRDQVTRSFGINPDSLAIDICVYVDILNQVDRRLGGKYDLTVKVDNKLLTATTTIPQNVPIEKFRWSDPPGAKNDTMARLWITVSDRPEPNFYRYLTSDAAVNTLNAPGQSTFDDVFFNGKSFEFPLDKAESFNDGRERTQDDFAVFGLYARGDTFNIKWATIDLAHNEFWKTRDASSNRGGPFASYIRIKSNIKGGLGIWGGYAANNYQLICPKK